MAPRACPTRSPMWVTTFATPSASGSTRGQRSSERGATSSEPVPSAGRAASPTDLGRVRAVIEALPEAVFVTEPDGGLRLTNTAADHLFEDRPIQDRSDLLG